MRLLLIFIVIPLTELWLLFEVADLVGGFETVMLVIMTAFFGIMLLKSQGVATLSRANQKWQMGSVPAQEIIEGFMLAFCGAMLLTPGFITDALGFLILLPPMRRFLASRITQQSIASFVKNVAGESAIKRARPGAEQWQSRSFGGQVYEGQVTKSSFAANDDEPTGSKKSSDTSGKQESASGDVLDAGGVDAEVVEAVAFEVEVVETSEASDHTEVVDMPDAAQVSSATVVSLDAQARRPAKTEHDDDTQKQTTKKKTVEKHTTENDDGVDVVIDVVTESDVQSKEPPNKD